MNETPQNKIIKKTKTITEHNHYNGFWLIFTLVITLLSVSCSKDPQFPTELKLERVLHQSEKTSVIGPGGLNNSFTVYELPQEVSATIAERGLPYLNTLPSVVKLVEKQKHVKTDLDSGLYWAPFVTWNATPVPKEEKWLRYGSNRFSKDWKPSISTFYQGWEGDTFVDHFISTIPPEFSDQFHEAISTPGNFYAYGFYRDKCILVVSPKTGRAFYLFRD
jgi:hypothetical protein